MHKVPLTLTHDGSRLTDRSWQRLRTHTHTWSPVNQAAECAQSKLCFALTPHYHPHPMVLASTRCHPLALSHSPIFNFVYIHVSVRKGFCCTPGSQILIYTPPSSSTVLSTLQTSYDSTRPQKYINHIALICQGQNIFCPIYFRCPSLINYR